MELWDIINVNVGATTLMTRLVIGDMQKRRRGAIVNVSSGSEFQPLPLMTVYAATKAYVKSFSDALRAEYSRYGITVQHLSPLYVNTKMNAFSHRLQVLELLLNIKIIKFFLILVQRKFATYYNFILLFYILYCVFFQRLLDLLSFKSLFTLTFEILMYIRFIKNHRFQVYLCLMPQLMQEMLLPFLVKWILVQDTGHIAFRNSSL